MCTALYPAPESNRHGFPQVFETSASTNSASWAFAYSAGCKCINCIHNYQDLFKLSSLSFLSTQNGAKGTSEASPNKAAFLKAHLYSSHAMISKTT
jgi:hypothetical protein